MRKTLVLVTVVLFICAFSLSAAPINIFGNFGLAMSDFEGMFLDIGAEMQLSGPIWGQVVFDYYLSPSGLDMPAGMSDSAYGGFFYGVFKNTMNDTMTLFAKAGVGYTTYEISYLGFGISASAFGLGGGAGIEYKVGPKMAILAGGTFKTLFDEGDTLKIFKIYCGFSYQVGN
ncbi:MAG: outer membrane beta-barrel protein [Candidatus Aminicenantes bacterium]|nr:outer membrane beta-barrel protein [Candidatus Aminicenantes bacterium]